MLNKLKTKENFFVPKILGWLGTVPFIIFAFLILIYSNIDFKIKEIGIAYSSIILSFLGAVHWGFLLGNKKKPMFLTWIWVWSITPSLISWVGLSSMLLLNSYKISSIILALGYVCSFNFDYKIFSEYQWYKNMRIYLTIIAILCTVIIGFK